MRRDSVPQRFDFTKERASCLRLRAKAARRFSTEARLQLAVIEAARAAGLSIAEIKVLFHGFRPGTPASNRWRRLAKKKLKDINQIMVCLEMMEKLLKDSMRCRCLKLEDCGRILLSCPEKAEVRNIVRRRSN